MNKYLTLNTFAFVIGTMFLLAAVFCYVTNDVYDVANPYVPIEHNWMFELALAWFGFIAYAFVLSDALAVLAVLFGLVTAIYFGFAFAWVLLAMCGIVVAMDKLDYI